MNLYAPAKSRRATYQDVLDAPPNMIAQIVNGRLDLQPRPATPHAFAGSAMTAELLGPHQTGRGGPGGWWILFEPELHLSDHVLVPDLAGWRRERMPDFPRVPAIELAPDWVCEILSPSTRRLDQFEKRAVYAEQGVPHLWFVDPDARTLDAFALEGGRWTLVAALADEAEAAVPPFEAVAFPLGALWPPAPPAEGE